MLKIYFVSITVLLCSSTSFSQEIDCNYLSSIIYLKVNHEINDQIRQFFRIKPKRKGDDLNFSVSNKIIFWDIEPFKKDIFEIWQNYGFQSETLKEEGGYRQKYSFETFTNDNLNKILPKNEESLHLYFSRPIGNTLIVEITNIGLDDNLSIRFGKGFRILFFFNDEGLVERVFSSTFVYN